MDTHVNTICGLPGPKNSSKAIQGTGLGYRDRTHQLLSVNRKHLLRATHQVSLIVPHEANPPWKVDTWRKAEGKKGLGSHPRQEDSWTGKNWNVFPCAPWPSTRLGRQQELERKDQQEGMERGSGGGGARDRREIEGWDCTQDLQGEPSEKCKL